MSWSVIPLLVRLQCSTDWGQPSAERLGESPVRAGRVARRNTARPHPAEDCASCGTSDPSETERPPRTRGTPAFEKEVARLRHEILDSSPTAPGFLQCLAERGYIRELDENVVYESALGRGHPLESESAFSEELDAAVTDITELHTTSARRRGNQVLCTEHGETRIRALTARATDDESVLRLMLALGTDSPRWTPPDHPWVRQERLVAAFSKCWDPRVKGSARQPEVRMRKAAARARTVERTYAPALAAIAVLGDPNGVFRTGKSSFRPVESIFETEIGAGPLLLLVTAQSCEDPNKRGIPDLRAWLPDARAWPWIDSEDEAMAAWPIRAMSGGNAWDELEVTFQAPDGTPTTRTYHIGDRDRTTFGEGVLLPGAADRGLRL